MNEVDVPRLLDAMVGIARTLSLPDILRGIVRVSCDVVDARCGAIGVLGTEGTHSEFVTVGVTAGKGADIGDPPAGRAALCVPILVRDRVFGDLRLTEKRGGTEFTELDEKIIAGLAAAAGVAIENATLFEQARRRERWLAASYDVTSAILGGEDLASTLHLVAEQARTVAGGSVGAIARPRETDRSVLVFDMVDAPGAADQLVGLMVPIENTPTGIAFSTREPVVVRDYGDHVVPGQGQARGLPPMVRGLDSAVAVPLVTGDETLGVLVVARFRDATPFTDAEVELARTFAGHAALAIAFARAEHDRRQLALFGDRDRIARDLHDVVIQRLFATGLGLEGVSKLVADSVAAERIAGFARDLDRTIRDIRNSIFSLREPVQARDSLRSELLRTVLDAAGMLGFEPRISFDGPLDVAVTDPVRSDLVGTLREALANVARHACAATATVEVSVDRAGRVLTLLVADDGIGMPATPVRRSGIANLTQRATRWHGTCSIRAGGNGGTSLEWQVRLPAAETDTRKL